MISFTVGQAIAAVMVILAGLAMIRCAIEDFDTPAWRLFGVSGAVMAAIYLITIVQWRSL